MVGEVSFEVDAKVRVLVGRCRCGTCRSCGNTRSAGARSEMLKQVAAEQLSTYEDS